MKCSLGNANFLEEICSISICIVFLYFFLLITEECFLISPCYSLELCIQMGISFLFSFVLSSHLFTAICKASSDTHFAFLHFFFLGMVLITIPQTLLKFMFIESVMLSNHVILCCPLFLLPAIFPSIRGQHSRCKMLPVDLDMYLQGKQRVCGKPWLN